MLHSFFVKMLKFQLKNLKLSKSTKKVLKSLILEMC